MSKSFSITLPDVVESTLSDWAIATGRNRGNLIAFLLEALARLKYPHRFTDIKLPEDIDIAEHNALLSFVVGLSDDSVNAADVALIAKIAGIDVDELQRRVDKSKG